MLLAAIERTLGVSHREFLGAGKGKHAVRSKEIAIVAGRRLGANVATLALLTGLTTPNISRRHAAATTAGTNPELASMVEAATARYRQLSSDESHKSKA